MRNLFFRIFPLLITLIFLGCDAEENVVSQPQEIKVRRLSFDEIRKMPAAYKAMQKKLPKATGNGTNHLQRLVYDAERDYYLDTDRILEVSKDGYSAITIPVYRLEKPSYDENLYLAKNPDGKYTTFLIRYNLTDADRKNYLAGGEIEGLPGKTLILDLNQEQADCVPEIYSHCYYNVTVQWQANQSGPGGDVHGGTAGVQTPLYVYTLDHCDYTVLECYEFLMDSYPFIGTHPGGGGPGGGSSPSPGSEVQSGTHPILVPIISPSATDPCGSLADLGDPQKINFVPEYNWLKQKVDGTVANQGERGVTFKKSWVDGELVFGSVRNETFNGDNVELRAGLFFFASAHTHPINGHPMFSFGDVMTLNDTYQGALQDYLPYVTLMLVCKDPATGLIKTYAIKIDNPAALQLAIDNKLAAAAGTTYDEKLNNIMKEQGKKYDKCSGQFELEFLKQFAGFGLSLYKANDETFTKWTKLSRELPDLSIVKQTPC